MSVGTVSAVDLRNRIGDILNRVGYRGERFIIARKGKPAAAIVSVDDLRRLEEIEYEREVEMVHLARIAAEREGVVPFQVLIDRYEQLHGERLELPANV